jgi:hypothetical protein
VPEDEEPERARRDLSAIKTRLAKPNGSIPRPL